MNTKYLIETLIQIPDKELFAELSAGIRKSKHLLLPDLRKFFHMLSCVFQGREKSLQMDAVTLYRDVFDRVVGTELEVSWNETHAGVLSMLGEEDREVRRMAKQLCLDLIDRTNNANMMLEKLYYEGLESESILVAVTCIKLILKILQTYKTILQNKTSYSHISLGVNLIKMVLQKMVIFAHGARHVELQRAAREFIDRLFFLRVQRMDEVLLLLNEEMLRMLEKIWAKNKEQMLRDGEGQAEGGPSPMQIQYEHLPLMDGRFFGIYEPFVMKHIFNPEVQAAKCNALKLFREGLEREEPRLQKYMNIIYKIIIRFLPEKHYDLILMLKQILSRPGKNNVINLAALPALLIPQLSAEQVPYRKELREALKILHLDIAKPTLHRYGQELADNPAMDWLQLFQILCLLEHWVDANMEASYPPALNPFLPTICAHTQSTHVKVRDQSLSLLLMILDRYAGYRENMEDIFTEQRIEEIEDMVEQRRNRRRGRNPAINESEQIYRREYEEERARFKKYQVSHKDPKYKPSNGENKS